MTDMKILNKRILITLSLVAIMLVTGLQMAFAAGGVRMPDLSSDTSNLTIKTQYTDEKETTPISGMELTIHKVADVSVKDGVADYTATEKFASLGINFNEMTTESSISAADDLHAVAAANGLKGQSAVSDGSGTADFGAVSNGIYLVTQTSASGDAEDYTGLNPYLVMAPMPLTDIGENDWEYNVVSIPKMAVSPLDKTIKITKKVNSENNTTVTDQSTKFTYQIITEIMTAPEDFAVVDNVPEQLEIVDKNLIEVSVNGTKISDAERDALINIKGNTLRIEPTNDQLKEWAPLEMTILFKCKFRKDIELIEKNLNVVNVVGYEVKGEYYETPGDDNEAAVKGVFKVDEDEDEAEVKAANSEEPEAKRVKGTNTGDYTRIGLIVFVMILAAAGLVFMRRRRAR